MNGVYSTLYKVRSVNMNVQTHTEMASLIWRICNLLRGPYKRNEYRKVILPLTVLRRFDCVLAEATDTMRLSGRPGPPVQRSTMSPRWISGGSWTTPTESTRT